MQDKSWVEKYRPQHCADLIGNEEAVASFTSWLRSWGKLAKTKKASLIVGPPGVGKTSLARAAAADFNFRVIELNASDTRTEKTISKAIAPASASLTLDSFSEASQSNLILMDEVDGVFGREDRGGLGAILNAIEDTPIPIVLTANDVEDERFDELRKVCLLVELHELRPRLLIILLRRIMNEEGAKVDTVTVETIVKRSHGDIRSAINDTQAAAAGHFHPLNIAQRTQLLDMEATLRKLFGSHEFNATRGALNQTEIALYKDDLLLLLQDILPYVYKSPEKLASAYDTLSRADIAYGRIGASRSRGIAPPPFNLPRRDAVPQWNLLPVALNELASIGIHEVDCSVDDALKASTRPSQKTVERYLYRLWTVDRICGRLARACHVSRKTARRDILPFLIGLFRVEEASGIDAATAMELEERDVEFLKAEAKSAPAPTGPAELLNPNGFKLSFMGKDKFIQLMRLGIKYDSSNRLFSLRRMDRLDSVEEGLSQIIGRPVKFARSEPGPEEKHTDLRIVKTCYVDAKEVPCDSCEFIEVCPTHFLQELKYCVCTQTLSDAQAYEKYVAKTRELLEQTRSLKKVAAKKAKPARRKTSTARD